MYKYIYISFSYSFPNFVRNFLDMLLCITVFFSFYIYLLLYYEGMKKQVYRDNFLGYNFHHNLLMFSIMLISSKLVMSPK